MNAGLKAGPKAGLKVGLKASLKAGLKASPKAVLKSGLFEREWRAQKKFQFLKWF